MRTASPRKVIRSFFTRKLERKFEEKGLQAPQHLLNLMDVPFEEFTPVDRELYESELKPLAFVFADHLLEVYRAMGNPREGWEEMLGRMKDSPAKVVAALVLHHEERAQALEDPCCPEVEEAAVPPAPRQKINARTYRNGKGGKERWWEKKIF
ncbi:MAG: hypothetical protein H5T72_08025 [Actinobacteria bacterium]|nr:hypothetical protein [Actinomycetota bacterium]